MTRWECSLNELKDLSLLEYWKETGRATALSCTETSLRFASRESAIQLRVCGMFEIFGGFRATCSVKDSSFRGQFGRRSSCSASQLIILMSDSLQRS